MSKFNYCQFVLLNRSCDDYLDNNCDECNIYKAYIKGTEDGAAAMEDMIKEKREEQEQE